MNSKSLSAGHALVSGSGGQTVLVANFSHCPKYVPKGALLGHTEQVESMAAICEELIDETIEAAGTETPKLDIPILSEADYSARVGRGISENDRARVTKVLMDFSTCFARHGQELGRCNQAVHKIATGNATPIHQLPYKSAWKEREIIQRQVDTMLKQGIIEASDSPWSSPVVLVKKKDGEWRFCVDYRKLNNITVKDVYPLPRIDDALCRHSGSKFFSIMDLQSGYHQIELDPED